MVTKEQIDLEMETLEKEANELLFDQCYTPVERRIAFSRLLKKYSVLEDYKKALEFFIRRMRKAGPSRQAPPDIVMEMLSSPEFSMLSAAVFAAFLSVVYSNGPNSAWVPTVLITNFHPPSIFPTPAP